jgi:hypothetical protein
MTTTNANLMVTSLSGESSDVGGGLIVKETAIRLLKDALAVFEQTEVK